MHKNNCRVCGFELSYPPWGEDDISPTWEICVCCGTSFDYEDCTIIGVKAQSKRVADGRPYLGGQVRRNDSPNSSGGDFTIVY